MQRYPVRRCEPYLAEGLRPDSRCSSRRGSAPLQAKARSVRHRVVRAGPAASAECSAETAADQEFRRLALHSRSPERCSQTGGERGRAPLRPSRLRKPPAPRRPFAGSAHACPVRHEYGSGRSRRWRGVRTRLSAKRASSCQPSAPACRSQPRPRRCSTPRTASLRASSLRECSRRVSRPKARWVGVGSGADPALAETVGAHRHRRTAQSPASLETDGPASTIRWKLASPLANRSISASSSTASGSGEPTAARTSRATPLPAWRRPAGCP